MNENEITECFEFVQDLVKKSGDVLNEGFKDCGEVTVKTAYYDLLTLYDGKIEEMLMEGIKKKFPEHKYILSINYFIINSIFSIDL